jgi:heptaprenyl diphosphate synthase
MDRLEVELRNAVIRDDVFLDELSTHLIAAGGKRLRPALTLAAAGVSGADASPETLQGGVAVELVHLASLYHDDVMDEATQRRNVISVNARWGNLLAIFAGDFLFARSAEIGASLGTEIGGLLAATFARLCQGQVAEIRSAFQIERTEQSYLDSISNKTAALLSTACRIGGITGGLDRSEIDTLTTFGECFGMLFQLRDDVLDVLATEAELGKPPGQDLAEGIYTLPVLRALAEEGTGPELKALLGTPLGPTEVDTARRIVTRSGGIAATVDAARAYSADAARASERLGDGLVPKSLTALSVSVFEDLERLANRATG